MEDVLAIYEKPYNPAQPVVCLDDESAHPAWPTSLI
jgi:hypothetical protein